ncbi:MAG TPA: hypothetical protein VF721_14385 [Pyrinomonadaceae bacterium]|jgi:hypothetical protein
MKVKDNETKADEYMLLLKANNKPEPSKEDKKALVKHFDEFPKAWQHIGDFAGRIQEKIIADSAADSFLVQESYRRKLAAMRDGLGWQTASEMEKILIEQVCLNWLRLNFTQTVHRAKTRESHSIKDGLYLEKLLDGAEKRFTRACEALAKVKKLLAEANFRDEQALNKRAQSAALANKVLQDSSKT